MLSLSPTWLLLRTLFDPCGRHQSAHCVSPPAVGGRLVLISIDQQAVKNSHCLVFWFLAGFLLLVIWHKFIHLLSIEPYTYLSIYLSITLFISIYIYVYIYNIQIYYHICVVVCMYVCMDVCMYVDIIWCCSLSPLFTLHQYAINYLLNNKCVIN